MTPTEYGFIFTRCVINNETNDYWIECYNKIRYYYPFHPIMIIDDHSNPFYITQIKLINCHIIYSEFEPRKGELLAYYYYFKFGEIFAKKAIILHDSTFINTYIDFDVKERIKFIWCFSHEYDKPEEEIKLLLPLSSNAELLEFYNNKKLWLGCFGVQSIIELSFLKLIVNKYNLFILLDYIKGRNERYHIERIFGVICNYEEPSSIISLCGNIHNYKLPWGFSYNDYLKNELLHELPFIKIWHGR